MNDRTDCVFCDRLGGGDFIVANDDAIAFLDAFPLSEGHCLIVPRRHEADFLALTKEELAAIWVLVPAVRRYIEAKGTPAGYNLGINAGEAAGQTIGHAHLHLIPRYKGDCRDANTFDNRVMLKPDVGEYFLQLNGLLRPLIQRRWTAMVAHLNRLEESQLEQFLFGANRTPTAKIRAGLWDIQGRRCFYCDTRITEPVNGDVDHFVPWSRYPDDTLDNFVIADKSCNGLKSSSLAAADHLTRWTRRFADGSSEHAQLSDLATGRPGTANPIEVSTSLVRSTCGSRTTPGCGSVARSSCRPTPSRSGQL